MNLHHWLVSGAFSLGISLAATPGFADTGDGGQIEPAAAQIVAGAVDRQQAGRRWDGRDGGAHLGDRAEWVGGALDEQGRYLQPGKMLGAQPLGRESPN